MIFKRFIESFMESYRSDLRRSVRPVFKGDRSRFSSHRAGAETYLEINHDGIVLAFWSECGQLSVGINRVDARESPLLSDAIKLELKRALSSKTLKESERNRLVAELIRDNI